MIDKYYLRRYVYSTPQLTSNVIRYNDDPLGAVMENIWKSIPKPVEEYTDEDWGSLYDKRVDDIDRAMRQYITAGGPYEGEDALSLIDQYNVAMQGLKSYRDLWIKQYARCQEEDVLSYKSLLKHALDIYPMISDDVNAERAEAGLPPDVYPDI